MAAGGLSCGSKMAKYFLFIFNITFWLIGAVILGVGIWVLVDHRALQLMQVASADSSDSLVRAAAITFIVIGLIVFVTGFLGCCGAIKENACMLLTYAIIVGIILFLQLIAGIMGAVFKDKILSQLGTSMNTTVKIKYGDPKQAGLTEAYDFVQKEFHCCGALTGPEDWADSNWKTTVVANVTKGPVPISCCPLVDENAKEMKPVNETLCYAAAEDKDYTNRGQYVWTKGCRPQLEDWVVGHSGLLIGIAFGLAVLQVFGIVLACCLRSNIKKGYEYV